MIEKNILIELQELFGAEYVKTDNDSLQSKSSDLCPYNLFVKEQDKKCAPVIVAPHGENVNEQLQKCVALAIKHNKKIVVYGGGSGVCGAIRIEKGDEIIVDMTELSHIKIIAQPSRDESGIVEVGSGVLGKQLDDFLKQFDYTHGHYPASLDISTVGGWVQTKGNGHHSAHYGNIENLVLRAEGVNGKGEIILLEGDDLKKIFRMEGTTMIITKIWLKIFTLPSFFSFHTFSFDDTYSLSRFINFLTALRTEMSRKNVKLYTFRAYDFIDAKFIAKPGKQDSQKSPFAKKSGFFIEKLLCYGSSLLYAILEILEKQNKAPWTVIIQLASDDEENLADIARRIEHRATEKYDAKNKGSSLAAAWYQNPFKQNYEKLLERHKAGITVDTFDCVPQRLRSATYAELRKKFFKYGLAGAHIGLDKGTVYFYFTFAMAGNNVKKYTDVWNAILATCVSLDAHTTHHHGVGRLRGKTGSRFAYGDTWYETIALPAKKEMDPNNVLNPYNLLFKPQNV